MDNKIKTVTEVKKVHRLNPSKINTLDDVIKILCGLKIEIVLADGITNEVYENLKEYFD